MTHHWILAGEIDWGHAAMEGLKWGLIGGLIGLVLKLLGFDGKRGKRRPKPSPQPIPPMTYNFRPPAPPLPRAATTRRMAFVEQRGDPRTEAGHLVIAGQCTEGQVAVGDCFRMLALPSGPELAVDLEVTQIRVHDQPVGAVRSPDLAVLVLTGKGADDLAPGLSLRGSASF